MVENILFLGKANDFYCEKAEAFLRQHVASVTSFFGVRGDPFDPELNHWRGDYLISYLSPWIVPSGLLANCRKAAINFHPGSPHYPGIGCTNFALYEQAKIYGVTCHHMQPQVDTGAIISVKEFPVFLGDTVYSLTQRCYGHMLSQFYEVASLILSGDALPTSELKWTRKPFTRQQLNALCRLRQDMSNEEISRRVRAVTFPGKPGAYIEVDGQRISWHQDLAKALTNQIK